LPGPRAGAHALVERVGSKVRSPWPRDRPRLGVDADLREAVWPLTTTQPAGSSIFDAAEELAPGIRKTIDGALHDQLVKLWD
jgi:hypothetical protein